MRSPRTLLCAAALLAAFAASACAPITVHSVTGRDVNFGGYRTYRWAEANPRPTGDPRLDSNPFFEGRLMSAAERELAARGYERTAGPADLVLHFHAAFSQKLDIAERAQYEQCPTCGVSSVYDAGTIVLDLVDSRTNTLVWRSWAEGSMDGAIDNQQLMERRIDETIRKIVATIPPRL